MGQNASSTAGGGSAAAASSSSSQQYSQTQANGTGTAVQARRPGGTKVILNVYDPVQQQSTFGMGIFHTGIEINGVEYSFAGAPDAGAGTGVMTQQPRATPADGQWKFKESIELGEVYLSAAEFDKILRELQTAFKANEYDLLHRNCNSFTRAVARRLGVDKKYPSWVNRAATIGSWFVAPKVKLSKLDEQGPQQPVSVFKATTGYRLDGSTVAPDKKAAAAAAKSESKKAEPAEQKKGSAAAAGSSAAAKGGRRNPWADPNFMPPGMRKDPVVATGKIDAP